MMNVYCAALIALLAVFVSPASTDECKGCATLDEYNFDKVVSKFKAAVVKFDVSYPYGEKHNTFMKLSEELATNKDILVAQVGIKDYGDKDNEQLAKKYGIKDKEDLPVVLLFTEGKRDPIFYTETDWDINSLRAFVKTKSKIYIGLPGCLEKYDKIASKFLASSDKQKAVKDTEASVQKEKDEDKTSGETYVKYMKKVIEHGVDFIKQEIARLSKIVKEGKINAKKKEQLSYHINILHSFSSPSKDEL